MNSRNSFVCLVVVTSCPALAQVEVGAVQVDASALGRDYVTADVFVSVPDPSDWWIVGGIAGGPLVGGLEHHLYFDPDSTELLLTAPGNDTPQAEFATFVSLPRDQFANARFRNNGAATIVGGYLPPTPQPSLGLTELNIAFIEFPVSPDGTNVPDFGYIARVTLLNDPAVSGFATDDIIVAAAPGPGILLAQYEVASATHEHPAPLSEFTFGFYGVPEPSTLSLALLLLAASQRLQRRG